MVIMADGGHGIFISNPLIIICTVIFHVRYIQVQL